MIQVIDCRAFGRSVVAGIHVVSYTQKFLVDGVKATKEDEELDRLSGSTLLPGGSVVDWQCQNGVVTSQPGSRRASRAGSRAPSRAGSIIPVPTLNVIDEVGDNASVRAGSVAPSRRGSEAARSQLHGSALGNLDEVDNRDETLSMNNVARSHSTELLPIDAQSVRSGRSRHSLLPDNRSVLSFHSAGYENPAYQESQADAVSRKNELNERRSTRGSLSDGIGGLAPPAGLLSPDRKSLNGSRMSLGGKSQKSVGGASRKSIVASIKESLTGSKGKDANADQAIDVEKGEGEKKEGEEGEGGEEGEKEEEEEEEEADTKKKVPPTPSADVS